eukprot:2057105-Prymnesium_polylepis.1
METQSQPWWGSSDSYGTVRYPKTQWDADPHGTFWGVLSNMSHVGMPVTPVVGTSLITMAYTIIGGMPVSMLTDSVQGVAIFFLSSVMGITTWGVAGVDEEVRNRPGLPELYVSGPHRFHTTCAGTGVHP